MRTPLTHDTMLTYWLRTFRVLGLIPVKEKTPREKATCLSAMFSESRASVHPAAEWLTASRLAPKLAILASISLSRAVSSAVKYSLAPAEAPLYRGANRGAFSASRALIWSTSVFRVSSIVIIFTHFRKLVNTTTYLRLTHLRK